MQEQIPIDFIYVRGKQQGRNRRPEARYAAFPKYHVLDVDYSGDG